MIKRTKLILFITLFAFVFPDGDGDQGGSGEYFAKVGTSGAQFLLFSPDAKFAAMGNAFVGIENNGASAAFYNPATLVYGEKMSFLFSQVSWFADIQYLAGAFSYQLNRNSAAALHYRMLDSGNMKETTVRYPDGTGNNFSWNSYALGVSYATFLTDKFSFGANLYWVNESVNEYDYSAGNWAVDLGTFYQTGFRTLKLGMNIRNFGPELDFDETFEDYNNGEIEEEPESFRAYHMPLQFQVGVSYEFFEDRPEQSLTVGIDGVHPNDTVERFNIGAEYNYFNILFLRAGLYTEHDSASLMAGMGLNMEGLIQQKICMDYSVSNYDILGFVHQFSIGFTL